MAACTTILRNLGKITQLQDAEHQAIVQVPAGVVSAAPEARMKPTLEATGLEHVFQTVVSGDDVYRGRPDPEAYLYAAQQLGRPSVRCVVIGNSNQVLPWLHYVHIATFWIAILCCLTIIPSAVLVLVWCAMSYHESRVLCAGHGRTRLLGRLLHLLMRMAKQLLRAERGGCA